ncbi:MAG: IS1595 family transposase [Gemmatimonas sp.]
MNLTDPIFTDETKAREYFESIRWPEGPNCPHCGEVKRVYRLEGKSHRPGLFHCNRCNGQFTVTTGSVMESSHIPLTKWAMGFRLYAGSKKGFSANQLHRSLGITYKSAWFMAHRIREAMSEGNPEPMGGNGDVVEIDETYVGRKPGTKKGKGGAHKNVVLTLVTRGGKARSFHVNGTSAKELLPYVYKHVMQDTHIMTDEAHPYGRLGETYASHQFVTHGADEYVRGNVTTNTVEGFFSIFKRGMKGVYQHCSERHLQRYLREFDFRYSNREKVGVNDMERTVRAIQGGMGKRLTYQHPR